MKRSSKLPSPATAVAFVALLAALTGTAVALPGKNTVDSGDIRNSQVKSPDIRNGAIRGLDVREDTLTGGDVAESTLGTVPSANSANSATTAATADAAKVAETAGSADVAASLTGLRVGRASVGDGGEVDVLALAGYAIVLVADETDGCELVLRNVSAGDNGDAESEWGSDPDFDEEKELRLGTEGATQEGTEIADPFYAHNAATSIQGVGAITREGDFGSGAACTATARAFTP